MCKQDNTQLQNLCQSCGLCCDGTLFESVDLDLQDATILRESAGTQLQLSENKKYFHQPCVAYQNKSCVVYLARPQACQRYSCKLLRQLKKQEISWNIASIIVAETILQRDKLKQQIQTVMPIKDHTSLRRITKTFEETQRRLHGEPAVKLYGEIFLSIGVLQIRLERFFLEKKQENIPATPPKIS